MLEIQTSTLLNEDRTDGGYDRQEKKNALTISTNPTNHNQISPCVSPPTCASPRSLKPTLIEDDAMNNENGPDGQFLFNSGIGSISSTLTSGLSGASTDIPVDKENPMRCVECGEEFVNHFR